MEYVFITKSHNLLHVGQVIFDLNMHQSAYNLGLAYSLQLNYIKAKEFYSKALSVIELKSTKLEARLAESDSKSKGKGKATNDDPCVVDRKELEELKNLSPEIKARVSIEKHNCELCDILPLCQFSYSASALWNPLTNDLKNANFFIIF